jgi:hypothetical protein
MFSWVSEGVDELLRQLAQACAVVLVGGPAPGNGQPAAAKQRRAVPACLRPGLRRLPDPAPDHQVLVVGVDPRPQPRPGRQQRVVGYLRRLRVHRDQPLDNEPAEQVAGGIAVLQPRQVAQRDGAASIRCIVRHVHQAEEDPARHILLVAGEAGVDLFGGPGDRIPDAAACLVIGHHQLAAAAVLPGGEQRVREQRQRPGIVRRARRAAGCSHRGQITQQDLDQADFHIEAHQPGRLDDRGPHLLGRHGAKHHLALLQSSGDLGIAQRPVVEVGAQGEYHDSGAGQRADRADERLPLSLVLAVGEDLLELVNHDDRPAGDVGNH